MLACVLLCHILQAQEFVNPLPIPPLIESTRTDYHLNVIVTEHNFNPNGSDSLNTMIRTFAFEDAANPGTTTILGPSIAWQFGDSLAPQVSNMLPERTTCHWHGAHVPAYADGGPHQIIQPGQTWAPQFEVMDESATMWYHPHAMDITYDHVQMGLSGMIYVEDPIGKDSALTAIHDLVPHEYGINDFPLIFQTKRFILDSTGTIIIKSQLGYKDNYTYLVNGIKDPFLEVPHGMVRFRVLNGDGKFTYNFGISDAPDFNPIGFEMIATDAGYMDSSYTKDELFMAPGERTEWLFDFSAYDPGDTLYVYNKISGLAPGMIGDSTTTEGYAVDRNLLRFIVGTDPAPPSPIDSFPINLQPLENPPLSAVSNHRTKTFRRDKFMIDGQELNLFNIDGQLMNLMVVNDVILVDSTELWTLDNTTNIAHPFHIHDIHFWVTEIIDANGVSLDKASYPEYFAGPKDNVMVLPNWKLSFITTFADFGTEVRFDSCYMMHCHILPHEDRGMMGQFVVWNGKGTSVSVEDPALSTRKMKLYPNPNSRNMLFIEGESRAKSMLSIYTFSGQLLRSVELPPMQDVLGVNTAGIPPGGAVVRWKTVEGVASSVVIFQ